MTRGNQRNQDRAKAEKKRAEDAKGVRTDGLSHTKAKELDAEKMREKQAKALAKKAEEEAKAKAA